MTPTRRWLRFGAGMSYLSRSSLRVFSDPAHRGRPHRRTSDRLVEARVSGGLVEARATPRGSACIRPRLHPGGRRARAGCARRAHGRIERDQPARDLLALAGCQPRPARAFLRRLRRLSVNPATLVQQPLIESIADVIEVLEQFTFAARQACAVSLSAPVSSDNSATASIQPRIGRTVSVGGRSFAACRTTVNSRKAGEGCARKSGTIPGIAGARARTGALAKHRQAGSRAPSRGSTSGGGSTRIWPTK